MKRLWTVIGLILLGITACSPGAPEDIPVGTTPVLITASATNTQAPTLTQTPAPTVTLTRTPTSTVEPGFSFVVTSDMSHYSAQEYIDYPNFFAGLLAHVRQFGPGDFMVSVGDVIPAEGTDWTIDQVLGEDYPWFPLPGNHDFGAAEINFLQNYDLESQGNDILINLNRGPEPCPHTTYSFDYLHAHFVALNVYCNDEAPWGIDGTISETVHEWLAADLAETDKKHIFVFGHEPAFPQPDAQTGDIRHLNDSLDQYPEARDRFWQLLRDHEVLAYINGHTHGYSAVKIDGVWQLDAGQAMGVRAAPSPGTFLRVEVKGDRVELQTYRGEDGPGFSFKLFEELVLKP